MAQMEIKLRPFSMDDLHPLVHLANNPKVADNLMDRFPHPYGEEDGTRFIQYALSTTDLLMAIEHNGTFAGGIGLHLQGDVYRRNAELGYWLGEPFWGRGLATEAVRQIVPFGWKELPIDRIFARPFGSNLASQRVLEKAGFLLEGRFEKTFFKNGRYEDELVYAVRRQVANSEQQVASSRKLHSFLA